MERRVIRDVVADSSILIHTHTAAEIRRHPHYPKGRGSALIGFPFFRRLLVFASQFSPFDSLYSSSIVVVCCISTTDAVCVCFLSDCYFVFPNI